MYKLLREVAQIKRGSRVVKRDLSAEGLYPVFQNSMTPLGYYHKSNVSGDVTFVIAAGAAGEVGYSYTEFWVADDVYYFVVEPLLNSRYLYHFLLSKKASINRHIRRASIPRLSKDSLGSISIPIPSLSEQKHIVNILDKFDTLAHSLTEDLPQEVELRRKQYEYYREQLLTF